MLLRKLTIKEQSELLDHLFDFSFVNVNEGTAHEPCLVLFDSYENEFYETRSNCQFDFSTLSGIFSYLAHISKIKGAIDKQLEIKKALGLS